MARLRITQLKSSIGRHKRKKETLKALGLRKPRQSVIQPDNPAIRGMLKYVRELVDVETVD